MLKWPKWKTDLDVFQNAKNAFILEGNVHDLQVWINEDEESCTTKTLNDYLYDYLKTIGYNIVVFYNKVDGFFNTRSENDLELFQKISSNSKTDCDLAEASISMRKAVSNADESVAVIFDLANIAVSSPEILSEIESNTLARLLLSSKKSVQAISNKTGKMLTNSIYYIVEKANDLPAWFYLHNPYIKTITLTKIDKELRKSLINSNKHAFFDFSSANESELKKGLENYAILTEDFSTADLYSFITLCNEQKFSITNAKQAVDFYKFGQKESYWDKIDPDKIRNIQSALKERVKGQDYAIKRASEIIARASLGLTGIQKGSGTRPKGILFLAGPTGTGKTELAKTIAELIFGDESFITRFDMSEYQQPQSDQKLLGAPPGYVGYGAGGQLTNAVKEKPFNILLFDEIDKAHPSILDKFLQILDDGRMTDSFGETVYFSESLIIFTSNLGMTKENNMGIRTANVNIQMDYEEVRDRILESIKEYFINIGRPEILNRIGSNIIVFNYIKDDKTLKEIITLQLNKIKKNLFDERKIKLEFSDCYTQKLLDEVKTNLDNGARGVGNKIEELLINLLPSVLLKKNTMDNLIIKVLDLSPEKELVVEIEDLIKE